MTRPSLVIAAIIVLCMVVIAVLALLLNRSLPTREERVQQHSVYFEKTTPSGQRVPCVAINEDAITCKFP